MKTYLTALSLCLFLLSCQDEAADSKLTDDAFWRLGWRMIESSWNEDYQMASMQFDSLVGERDSMDRQFVLIGLEAKLELGREQEVETLLNAQPEELREKLCRSPLLAGRGPCGVRTEEVVKEPELQRELIRMFMDDQQVRGNWMEELRQKYRIDSSEVNGSSMRQADRSNRERLKALIAEYGFPTRQLAGGDAMEGVFYIIQHADLDKAWQAEQLSYIREAVERGELEAQNYAYLFDRIQVNNGDLQRYGTQFDEVDSEKGIATLEPVENREDLDNRRRKLGMMPIEMYKRLMLQSMRQ